MRKRLRLRQAPDGALSQGVAQPRTFLQRVLGWTVTLYAAAIWFERGAFATRHLVSGRRRRCGFSPRMHRNRARRGEKNQICLLTKLVVLP